MARISAILIPATLVEETRDPRVRTYKIGNVGRAVAAFGVPEIVLYDLGDKGTGRWVQKVLEYEGCPPYLRKQLYPLSPDLAHVGVLPPLNIPSHTVSRDPKEGELRLGLPRGREVDIGVDQLAKSREDLGTQKRLVPVEVVRVARGGHVEVAPYTGPEYTGYTVRRVPTLHVALREYRNVIGTSRDGDPVSKVDIPAGAALAFGSPSTGLKEILRDQEDRIPYINTVPGQRTRTIRTDEAIWASLAAVINLTA